MDRRAFLALLATGCGDADVNRNRAPIGRMNRRGVGASIGGASAPFTPAGIANLALWLDSTKQSYSDTGGTTPANSPDGRVRRIDQPTPLTGSWLAATDPTRPFVESASGTNYIYVPYLTRLAQPVGPTLNLQDCTYSVSFAIREWTDISAFGLFSALDSIGSEFSMRWNGGAPTLRYGSHNWNPAGLTLPVTIAATLPSPIITLTIRHTATTTDAVFTVNGVTTTASESFATPARTVSGITISPNDSSGVLLEGHLLLSSFVGVNRAMSDAERDALHTYQVAHAPAATITTAAPLLVVDGSSIEVGFGVFPKTRWASVLPPNVWGTAPLRTSVVAVSGRTIAQLAADYATRVKPFRDAARTKTILILAGGATNSMNIGGLNGAATLAAYLAYLDQVRTDGFLAIACTVLPRSGTGDSATFNADRATFNAGLAAGWASHADAFADPASVAGMGADGDSNNLTNYQSDKIHPTAIGQGLIEPAYRSAVLSLLP
jgi:GDSL-like lipase/acylhydrolase family protein